MRLIIIVIIMLFAGCTIAQTSLDFLPVEEITIEDGLSQGYVSDIIQDRKGFMWFATKDGLNRYDGHKFVVYRHDAKDPHSLSGSYTTSIYEDSKGRLWIGTADSGLNLFDKKTEKVIRVQHEPDNIHSIEKNYIATIQEDHEGGIWVGYKSSGIIHRVMVTADSIYSVEPLLLSSDVGDKESEFFIGPDSIMYAYNGNRFYLVDLRNKPYTIREDSSIYKAFLQEKPDLSPSSLRCSAIYLEDNSTVWLSIAGRMVNYRSKTSEVTIYSMQSGEKDAPLSESFEKIMIDNSGNLWASNPTIVVGFPKEQIERGRILTSKIRWHYNHTQSFTIDRSGIAWLGISGYGIKKHVPRLKSFEYLFPGSSTFEIGEKPSGELWFDGIKWNADKKNFLPYFNLNRPNVPSALYDLNRTTTYDKTGRYWSFGQNRTTGQAMFIQLGEEEKHNIYVDSTKRESGYYRNNHIYIDEAQNLWVVFLKGLLHFNQYERIFKLYPFDFTLDVIAERDAWRSMYKDGMGRLWIGTIDGLILFDEKGIKDEAHSKKYIKRYLPDADNKNSLSFQIVLSIHPDPSDENILWLGTQGGGLNRFDKKTEKFIHFTTKDGLPNDVVYGILSDEQGYLWLSTNKGLSKFNPQTGTFRNYEASDGLQGDEFNTYSYFKNRKGKLHFGGINGVTAFFPEDIKDNTTIPPIAITRFKLDNRPVDFTDSISVLDHPITTKEEIKLCYNQNMIGFEFVALDFFQPHKNQYAYMLEGLDDDWIYNGTDRDATFTNLGPGTYTFRVKGSNNDGVWNEEGASVKVIITPPWWATWWAYTLYTLTFLGVIALYIRYRLRRTELNAKLEAEQREAERLQEMNDIKTRLYTNITHEFRTPLTVILGMADRIIAKHKDQSKEEGQMIRRNGLQLLNLVNQMLDLAKLESGALPVHKIQGNIIPYLKYLAESFHTFAKGKNIGLHFLTDIEHLNMDYDPEKMLNIISNLLSNAIKFTPENGNVYMSVAEVKEGENAMLEIKVKDTGIGIPEEKLPYIFDRFYQVDDTHTRHGEGSGIGLTLSRELVKLLDGRIEVSSRVDKGTVFTIFLPVKQEAEKTGTPDKNIVFDKTLSFSASPVETEHIAVPEDRPEKELPLLLIIEDNPDVVRYLHTCLKNNYQLETASNGQIGIDKAIELIPDIIISDVMMPEKDGYQVCNTLKNDERTSHIPIILLTAKVDESSRILGLKAGADVYLNKPFNNKELDVRLAKTLELRKNLQKKYQSMEIGKSIPEKEMTEEDKWLQKINDVIEKNISNADFDIPRLSRALGMSRSQIFRKLKALTQKNITDYIRHIRLHKAKMLLKDTELSISEVCYDVGFKSRAHFSAAFLKEFGEQPSVFRKKTL